MLARCPACLERFGVVGSCSTACPFCGNRLSVRVERVHTVPVGQSIDSASAPRWSSPRAWVTADPRTAAAHEAHRVLEDIRRHVRSDASTSPRPNRRVLARVRTAWRWLRSRMRV